MNERDEAKSGVRAEGKRGSIKEMFKNLVEVKGDDRKINSIADESFRRAGFR